MTWRRVALIAMLFAAGCAGFAKSPRAAALSESSQSTPQHGPPLLWEVTGDAGTMFLFGTMHFGVASAELPPAVAEVLATCDTFVLESDPTAADQRRLADMMVLPRGSRGLDARLGATRWKKLLVLLDGMFEERVAKRLQPWVIEAAVIRELLPTEEAMETGLLAQAAERGLPIEYLETWETQISMLNRVTNATALAEIVDDPEGFKARTRQMSIDYQRGDLAALERHVFGPDYAAQDALFEDRNRAWLPRLDELARSSRAFVAVGAGHLIGPDSVLAMLEARGYTLRRVE